MKRKLNINIKTFVDSPYAMPVTMHTSFHIQPVEMPRSVKCYKIRIIYQSREALDLRPLVDTYIRKSGSLELISAWLSIRPVWWCACADTSQDGRMHCPSNVLFTIVPHCARRTVNGILLGQCVLPSCDVYARAHQQTGRINNHADISFKDPFFLAYVQWLVPEPLAPCMRKCNKILWTQSIVSSHSKGNENLP